MEKNLQISLLLDFYGELLTDKQREVTEMYYNDDMSLSEISENVGISRQGVRDAIKRAEQIMLTSEEKVGFCRKFDQYREGLNEILNICGMVNEKNKGYGYSRFTEEGIKEIAAVASKLLD